MSDAKGQNSTQETINFVDITKEAKRPQLKMVTESYDPFYSLIKEKKGKDFPKEERGNS